MGFFRRSTITPTPAPEPVEVIPENDKHRDLRVQLKEYEAERDAVLEKCKPLEIERQAAWDVVAAATAKAKAIGERIAALKTPAYRDTCNSIVVLTRALGGKTYTIPNE